MTNRKNCGALLTSDVCEYCGTSYLDRKTISTLSNNDKVGVLKIGNEEIRVYLSNCEEVSGRGSSYINANGKIQRGKINKLRKFTLIEF